MEWKDRATTLRFGQRRKVKHCDAKPSAYISNSPSGVSLHCFRCGANEFQPHGRLSAADIMRYRARDEAVAGRDCPAVEPLDGGTADGGAILWVLMAGITPERATHEYGFGWCAETSRVIVPILHNDEPTGQWTGRAIHKWQSPKYLMPKGSIGASWYRLRGTGTPCVVVEDILSAIRVVESGYNAVSVLGTSVGPTQAMLMKNYPVIGWFDGDKAGRNGFVKLRKALSPFGVEPKRISTPKDPKTYSRAAITQFIKDAL